MSTMLASALRDRAELFALLSIWSERGWLRELDRALAQLFAELDPDASPLLLLGAALAIALAVPASVSFAQDRLSALHSFPANWVYSRSFLNFVKKVNEQACHL